MKKVVLLPLDERPCNTKFPTALFESQQLHVVTPERMGWAKTPADTDELAQFLFRECRGADGLVVSMDMLLYGGLVPSRIHHISREELLRRLDTLRQLKRTYPSLRIFAFDCIMRCPTYSNSQEEPDYYGRCGAEIHAFGVARHKAMLGDAEQMRREKELRQQIPAGDLEDYLSRRERNLSLNLAVLDLAQEGIVDFLAIPQDDAAPYGLTALDQQKIRTAIREKRLQSRVMLYPGADELGMTLLARMVNQIENRCPSVYPLYASAGAPFVIPPFEDRPLAETVRYQIAAAGCRPAACPEQADIIMAITAPAANITGAAHQNRLDFDYDVGRSLTPFFTELCFWMDAGKPVTICDNAYTNGGDLELLSMLDASGRMMDVAGYAGWNTSSNTMGTAIAQGVRYLDRGKDQVLLDFLALRYAEDFAYDSLIRQQVTAEDLPGLGLDYFTVDAVDGKAAACVCRRLQACIRERMPSIADHICIKGVKMPWKRMFEADIDVSFLP